MDAPSSGTTTQCVLLVFLACGVMHAAPIVLGGTNRLLWAWLAAGTLAFFVIHAIGVLVDGAFRRRGGRPLLVAMFVLSLPLYPAPLAIASVHGLDVLLTWNCTHSIRSAYSLSAAEVGEIC